MIPSLSRGRSRVRTVRTANICSSCLSHSRLPLSQPRSPHTLNTFANYARRAQAASFSNSRATRNVQLEETSVEGNANDGSGILAGQSEQTVGPGKKSRAESNSIDSPSTANEKHTSVKSTTGSARGKKGQGNSRSQTWKSKIDDLKATFLNESASIKDQPERKASPKLEGSKSILPTEIAQPVIESTATANITKPQTAKEASKPTAEPKTQNSIDLTALSYSANASGIPPDNSWSLRTKQLQESFLTEEKQPAIIPGEVSTKDRDLTKLPPKWLLKISKLKSSFLNATPQPGSNQGDAAATVAVFGEPGPMKAKGVSQSTVGRGDKYESPSGIRYIKENHPDEDSQVEGAFADGIPVAKEPVSNGDDGTLKARPTRRMKSRVKRAAMRRKNPASQEESAPDIELQEALQNAFEKSFVSSVTKAIKHTQPGSLKKKARAASAKVPTGKLVRMVNDKKNSSKDLSIKEAMIRQPTNRRMRVRRTPTTDKSDGTVIQEIKLAKGMVGKIESVTPKGLELVPVNVPQPPVPALSYGLDRVLFNPGVYQLQDPRSRVFNFDPYLQTIMPVKEFDFSLLKKFITSSRDETLLQVSKSEDKKYTGSTSSMTAALSHFHYLISNWRPIDVGVLSKKFPAPFETFTAFQRSPAALYLRWRDGVYAIDADKQYDTSNILSMLGQSMEKLLTHSTEEFERYRKNSPDPVSEDTRKESEAYHYTTMGDFLMRSQLDAHDPRVPGTGMFDLKTRAVISIRMDTDAYEEGNSYEIRSRHGEWESFEREYYDMIRSAFLKYSLQVRIGRMDGIFVAFHNTERIFGFQYISLPEMDAALHGTEDTTLGDSEFKLSLNLLNRVLDRATAKWPNQSLRLLCETRPHAAEHTNPYMYIFAEPMDEGKIEALQSTNKAKIEAFEKEVLGLNKEDGEEMVLEERVGTEESGSNAAGRIGEAVEAAMVDQVDAVEDIEPSSSPAWDFDADESDQIAESARIVETQDSSQDNEGKTWDLDENVVVEKKEESDAEKAPNNDEESEPAIMAMYLTTRNKINGEPVQRPTSLKPEDEWELEYSLAEIQSPTKARSLYDACQQRRNGIYNRDKSADDTNEWANSFRQEIKKYTMKGKEYRARVDAEQSNEPQKVVYGSGFSKEHGAKSNAEQSNEPQKVAHGSGLGKDGVKAGSKYFV